MSGSSNLRQRDLPNPEGWITFAHELQLPPGQDFIAEPVRMPLDVVLDYCEKLSALCSIESILTQPDRVKSSVRSEMPPADLSPTR
jgi:hypothetical protein